MKDQPDLTEEQFKELVVSAVSSCNFPVTKVAIWATEQGFAKFVGGEHNNQHAWVASKLRHTYSSYLDLPVL